MGAAILNPESSPRKLPACFARVLRKIGVATAARSCGENATKPDNDLSNMEVDNLLVCKSRYELNIVSAICRLKSSSNSALFGLPF